MIAAPREPKVEKPKFCTPRLHYIDKDASTCACGQLAAAPVSSALPLTPIPHAWADAANAARGLCESEANRWEEASPATAEHWRKVAMQLGALYLAQEGLAEAVSSAPPQPRACACSISDPVMQADGRFYCHQCSFQSGARPHDLEPEHLFRRISELEQQLEAASSLMQSRIDQPHTCLRCGGPHPFDTSVPSVQWNRVIRSKRLPEYLCLTCIVREFVVANESFTADLAGGFHELVPIEIRIRSQEARDAFLLNEENTRLRAALIQISHDDAVDAKAIALAAMNEATKPVAVSSAPDPWRAIEILGELLAVDGQIIPVYNDEFLPASFVREVVNRAIAAFR